MTFNEHWSREQVEIRRSQLAAMQDAAALLLSIEESFGSYRTNAAKFLRSSRLRLKAEIQSEQWSLNSFGMQS